MSTAQTGVKVLGPVASALIQITFGAACIAGWELGKKLWRGRLWGKKYVIKVQVIPRGEIIIEGFKTKAEAEAYKSHLDDNPVMGDAALGGMSVEEKGS